MELSKDNVIPFIQDDGTLYFLLVSPPIVIEKIFELANLRSDETIYDLGSGDGRIIIHAGQKYGVKAVGIESNKELFDYSIKKIHELGLEKRVQVIYGDIYESDISEADVIIIYLDQKDINERLRVKLEKRMKEGGRVITVNLYIPGWRPVKLSEVVDCKNNYTIYLYQKESIEY
jgi:predicted RNA methylase